MHRRTRRPSKGLVVFPRHKLAKSGDLSPDKVGTSQAVVITQELLQSLSSSPLCQASDALGISVTALKRACRKIGLVRWPRKNERVGHSHGSTDGWAGHLHRFSHQFSAKNDGLAFDLESTLCAMVESARFKPYYQSSSLSPINCCGAGAAQDFPSQWDICVSMPRVDAQMNGTEHFGREDFFAPQKLICLCPLVLTHFGDGLSMEVPIIDLPELF